MTDTLPATKAHENNQLQLNPGVPQRKPRSAWKLCLWTILAISIFVGGAITYFIVGGIRYAFRHPHSKLYHVKANAEVSDWSQVVRPMITKDSTFDIIASVWVRDEQGTDGVIRADGGEYQERLIFSETVFRDVSLKSANALANVTLSVPTSHFKQMNLSNYDLRASFVLTQSNKPAWLDHFKSYTTWRPRGQQVPTVRKWEQEPTLAEQIYDSFGFSMPLIQFHNITSHRPTSPTVDESDATRQESNYDSDDEADWTDDGSLDAQSQGKNHQKQTNFILQYNDNRKRVTEQHPYIVTRTHLFVIDETELFNRQLYNVAHKGLANHTCVNPKTKHPYPTPEWYQCKRSHLTNGVFETKVQLRIPPNASDTVRKGNGKWRTEWMYAPYFSAVQRGPGPKDLVPVPVDREGTTEDSINQLSVPDEESVTITWRLAFSGVTNARMTFTESLYPLVYNMTAPEHELQDLQENHDFYLGLAGLRIHEDAHPRRSGVLMFAFGVMSILIYLLQAHYWYTRTSTIGIARLGTMLFALGNLIEAFREILEDIFKQEYSNGFLPTATLVLVGFFDALPTLFMLKAVLRLEFSWSTKKHDGVGGAKAEGWTPRIYFAKATHLERASERVEGRVSGRRKLAILAVIFATLHFLFPLTTHLIAPRIQLPTSASSLESLSPRTPTVLKYVGSLVSSLHFTGGILQLVMNFHSRTYAGKYKSMVVIWMLVHLLTFMYLSPSVLGRSTKANGFYVGEGVVVVFTVVDLLQAVRYRSVKITEEDVSAD